MEILLKYMEINLVPLGEIRFAKYFHLFQPLKEVLFLMYFYCFST